MKSLDSQFLETIFSNMVDAVYLIDPDTSNISWCNRAGYEDLGLSQEEVINHSVLSLQKDVNGLPQWQEIKDVIKNSEYFTFVGRHAQKDGSEIPVEINTTHFHHKNSPYFLSVARNVNKRVAFEKDLHKRQHRIWHALNEASDGLWEWNVATGYVFFSPQLKQMLGYGPEEMNPVVETWSNNIHPSDSERVLGILNDHIKGLRAKYQAEYRIKNRNGHYIWVHDQGSVCERDNQGNPTHVVGMVQNITDRKNLQLQLEQLAAYDVLTELPNRRKGEEIALQQLALATRSKTPVAVMIVDLDHFKTINDLYGHTNGDEVLKQTAATLKNAIRKTDYLYRWGGEEFVIILPSTDTSQAHTVAENIHQTLAENEWPGLEINQLTTSIGIASYPEHGQNFDVLFQHADTALYMAKANGRNQTCIVENTGS